MYAQMCIYEWDPAKLEQTSKSMEFISPMLL